MLKKKEKKKYLTTKISDNFQEGYWWRVGEKGVIIALSNY